MSTVCPVTLHASGRTIITNAFVAERYPNDSNGIAANVPIADFSSLTLGPSLMRVQEKPQANWITTAKINAIRGEFMRQCAKLDGLADGVINNYMACRALFDVKQGKANRHPWEARALPGNVDPNPPDTSADACLTDGQISTLEFVQGRYRGMWLFFAHRKAGVEAEIDGDIG
jgi:feruloyl esterase